MLGLAKGFIIFLGLAIGLSFLTKNILNGVVLLLMYVLVKVSWNLLTK